MRFSIENPERLTGQMLPCDGVKGSVASVLHRKNDPGSRPRSWHSSKLTEEDTESSATEAAPATVWKPKYEAR